MKKEKRQAYQPAKPKEKPKVKPVPISVRSPYKPVRRIVCPHCGRKIEL